MIAVDTNILIYAHREETPQHASAKQQLVTLAQQRIPWGIPLFALSEFVRVVTHPRVFTPPSSLAVALSFVDALLRAPHVMLLGPTDDYWSTFHELCIAADAKGNLVFDAAIAALCVGHGARLLTADRDFARFSKLETIPFTVFSKDEPPNR